MHYGKYIWDASWHVLMIPDDKKRLEDITYCFGEWVKNFMFHCDTLLIHRAGLLPATSNAGRKLGTKSKKKFRSKAYCSRCFLWYCWMISGTSAWHQLISRFAQFLLWVKRKHANQAQSTRSPTWLPLFAESVSPQTGSTDRWWHVVSIDIILFSVLLPRQSNA